MSLEGWRTAWLSAVDALVSAMDRVGTSGQKLLSVMELQVRHHSGKNEWAEFRIVAALSVTAAVVPSVSGGGWRCLVSLWRWLEVAGGGSDSIWTPVYDCTRVL